MQSTMAMLREQVDLLFSCVDDQSRRGRPTKTARVKAIASIMAVLHRRSVLTAISISSVQEMLRGPVDDEDKPVSWADLSSVLLNVLAMACEEAAKAKTASLVKGINLKSDYIEVFKLVVKSALAHGPPAVLRHLVRAFLDYAYTWLSDPRIRMTMVDDIWQLTKTLLQDDDNRAMLSPPFISKWVDACFEQITGKGVLPFPSRTVTNLAADVLQLIASPCLSYDTLTQTCRGLSPGKMSGGDFGYALIAERCCMMLVVADGMTKRDANDIQDIAFKTLSIILTDHALDVLGSNALKVIIQISLKPLITCWGEKKYQKSAVSLVKLLLTLAKDNKQLKSAIRHRILSDMKGDASSASIRSGEGVSEDYVESVANCFTLYECLQYLTDNLSRGGVAVTWLRVIGALVCRRVLQKDTNILVNLTDVFHNYTNVAESLILLLKHERNARESSYSEIIRHVTNIINIIAPTSNTIYLNLSTSQRSKISLTPWQSLYHALREHSTKAKYSVPTRGVNYTNTCRLVSSAQLLVDVLAVLCSLDFIENDTIGFSSEIRNSRRFSLPFPLSRIVDTTAPLPSESEFFFFRNLLGRNAIHLDDRSHLRHQLLISLLRICRDRKSQVSASLVEDASAAALSLTRGECTIREESTLFARSYKQSTDLPLVALHEYLSWYGLHSSDQIEGEGPRLVSKVRDQERLWLHQGGTHFDKKNIASTLVEESKPSILLWKVGMANLRRHVAVDSSVTKALEAVIVREVLEGLGDSTNDESDQLQTHTGNQKKDEEDLGKQLKKICGSIEGVAFALKVTCFLGHYIRICLHLGLVALAEKESSSDFKSITSVFAVLMKCLGSATAANLLGSPELTTECIVVAASVSELVLLETSNQVVEGLDTSWKCHSEVLSDSLKSLSTSLSGALVAKIIKQSDANVSLTEKYVSSMPFEVMSDRLKRTGTKRTQRQMNVLSKRRRVSSPTHSSSSRERGFVSDHSSQPPAETNDFHRDGDSDDSELEFHQGSSSRGRERNNHAVIPNNGSMDYVESLHHLSVAVVTCSGLAPFLKEAVLDTVVNGLRTINEHERVFDPESFERAAITSHLIDSSFLKGRTSIWEVLLAIQTDNSLAAVVKDVLIVGEMWKQLEVKAQDYILYYVREFAKGGKRSLYAVSCSMEDARVCFLKYAQSIVGRCFHLFSEQRNSSIAATQLISKDLVNICKLLEYFKSRHGFRMPRTVRVAYLRFSVSAMKLSSIIVKETAARSCERSSCQTLAEALKEVSLVVIKFLGDTECVVRMQAAHLLGYGLLADPSISLPQLELSLQKNLPNKKSCEDCLLHTETGSRHVEGELEEDIFSTWRLTSSEETMFKSVHSSFRKVGAMAKGYSTIVALSEMAAQSTDLLPFCVTELTERVATTSSLIPTGYQALLHICVELRCTSPRTLYSLCSRLFLPKWFMREGALDRLDSFPASLFVDSEHYSNSVLYNWMRDHQGELISHLLVNEESRSLDRTLELAKALNVDIRALLTSNVTSFSLLFPMQFMSGSHEKGQLLWKAVDNLLNGKGKKLMSERKSEVISVLLRSVSANTQASTLRSIHLLNRGESTGFHRDARTLNPPLYDPLVISLALNHLLSSKSSTYIFPKSTLQGSIFTEVRDSRTNLVVANDFKAFGKEIGRKNATAIGVYTSILYFFAGPPSPQLPQNRIDAYFCVGMLWRMLGANLLMGSRIERMALYGLLGRGFEYDETAPDAAWLLHDVQKKVSNLHHSLKDEELETTTNHPDGSNEFEGLDSKQERLMFELIRAMSPVLASGIVTGQQHASARINLSHNALKRLLSSCEKAKLWNVILANGPFPTHKTFKELRRLYERSKSLAESSNVVTVFDQALQSAKRFQGISSRPRSTGRFLALLASLQELNKVFTEDVVLEISQRIMSETWMRSSDMCRSTGPVIETLLSCVVDFMHECFGDLTKGQNGFSQSLSSNNFMKLRIIRKTIQEIANLLSSTGLLLPFCGLQLRVGTRVRLIPAFGTNACHEDETSGIALSVHLLQDIICSSSVLQSEIALNTLTMILRYPDGIDQVMGRRKEFPVLGCFQVSEKISPDVELKCLSLRDPETADVIPDSVLPDIYASETWPYPGNNVSESSQRWSCYLCASLAKKCRSKSLQSLSAICLVSSEFSLEILPYLLMDIVCDFKEQDLDVFSSLLQKKVYLNCDVPSHALRAFVHSLDVLCQIGLGILSSAGLHGVWEISKKPKQLAQLYILEVPYLEAAQAALRSGAYCSALRFAQFHIDQAVIQSEFEILANSRRGLSSRKRYSSCEARHSTVEEADKLAREECLTIIQEALKGMAEPDGLRAFTHDSNLANTATTVAQLNGDWTRSLAALEMFSRNDTAASQEETDGAGTPKIRTAAETTVDFQKENGILQAFIRLGTFKVAVDYWDGLRRRVLKHGWQSGNDQWENSSRIISQMNDLRYAAAWKLERWETPLVLPSDRAQKTRSVQSGHSFHKSVYSCLRAFTNGRYSDIPQMLNSSRMEELRRLYEEEGSVPAKSIFESAARLRVLHMLSCTYTQRAKPGYEIHDIAHVHSTARKGSTSVDDFPFGDVVNMMFDSEDYEESSGIMDHSYHTKAADVDMLKQIAGNYYGIQEKKFKDGLLLSRDAFDESIAAEDLPVILARCLERKSDVTRIAATVSARVLEAGRSGSWARSVSCLGNQQLSYVNHAPIEDQVAWRMQEARLKWRISNDAPSKKQALDTIKEIILRDLGLSIDHGSSGTSDSSRSQSLEWQMGDVAGEMLAFLRLEACCMAAEWSSELRTDEPMDLFKTFLGAGLKAVDELPAGKLFSCRAHFAMARFADEQITNIDIYRKTATYEELVRGIRHLEEKNEKLKEIQAASHSRSRSASSRRSSASSRSALGSGTTTVKNISRDLAFLISSNSKKARQDSQRIKKLDADYRHWQVQACKHYAACLRDGSTYDLRAAFRMVALWLDSGSMREHITRVLTALGGMKEGHSTFLNVPVAKLLPLAPQLASRLNYSENNGEAGFQNVLAQTLSKMAGNHPAYCLWQLIALSNAMRKCNSERLSTLYKGDKDKKDAADKILDKLEQQCGEKVLEMKKVADAYIALSEMDPKKKESKHVDIGRFELARMGELRNVPVPTIPLPPNAKDYDERTPYVKSFVRQASVCNGLSRPLRVICIGSDGNEYPQMVKGRDDLRGDAVMEQLFCIVNTLLAKDGEASKRGLHIRTYRVLPLSPFSGIMQFVSNTKQVKEVLVEGDDQTRSKTMRKSLHERHRPHDIKHSRLFTKVFDVLRSSGPRKAMSYISSVWSRFQPAFHYFFLEQWPDPREWFSHQLNYSRSVAVMSIVGFIVGLGDRHLSNILLDVYTGEIVHIDFGVAFELGKLLPTPEKMPFRLTRDIVDGFGIGGVEGVFRRCCEITLDVMRNGQDVLLTVVEVLLHDPMYSWALAPEEVVKDQLGISHSNSGYARDSIGSEVDDIARKVEKTEGSKDAKRALNRIKEKLDGLEGTERLSAESHVARLIDEAQALHVLTSVYPGWCPWI